MGSTGVTCTPPWCHAGATLRPATRGCSGRRRSLRSGRWRTPLPGMPEDRRGDRRTTPGGHTPRIGRPDHGQITLLVGSVDAHSVAGEPGECPGRGMAIGVVRPHRDQGDPGTGGGQEFRVGVTASVMRHFQHVCPQIDPAGHQPGLRLRSEVAGEQDPHAPDGHAGNHREVVGRYGRRGPGRVGRQHLHPDAADCATVPRQENGAPPSGAVHEPVEGADAVVGR